MIYKTTITADTTNQEGVSSAVEIHTHDGVVVDIIINNDELSNEDKIFFAWEAINEMGEYPEVYMTDFF